MTKRVPEIRFEGFTDDWEQRKLGKIAPLRGGFAFKSSEFQKEGIPIVRISNILTTGEVGGDFIYYPEQVKDDNYLLPDRSAVLAMSGATTGKVSVLSNPNGGKVYQNQRVGYFTKTDVADYGFISTITRSQMFIEQLGTMLVAGAQPNISSKDIDMMNFTVPTNLEEQTKIGSFFQGLDNTITLHQRKLEQLQSMKDGFLQKMFPIDGEKEPEIRFPGFTDDWEQRKFNDIVKRLSKTSDSNEIPKVEFEDIIAGEGRLNKDVSKKFDNRKGIIFNRNNILYGKLRPYLKNWLLTDFEGIALGDFWVFESKGSEPDFVYSLIQAGKYQKVANDTSGTKMPRSDWKRVSTTPFLVPNFNEQTKIGQLFRELDNTIALHQRELELLKQTKKAFLQKMFV